MKERAKVLEMFVNLNDWSSNMFEHLPAPSPRLAGRPASNLLNSYISFQVIVLMIRVRVLQQKQQQQQQLQPRGRIWIQKKK